MNQKSIIIAIASFMLLASLFLAYTERKQLDENSQKDWWVLYFEKPQSREDLGFTIENHGKKSAFSWEIYLGENKIGEDGATLPKGEKKTVPATSEDIRDKKITIIVSDGAAKKEIYKNL